jgi:SHS2 domain-containing protein
MNKGKGAVAPIPAAHWEHFHHGADIGVRGIGESREEAFVQAAIAMTAVMLEPEMVNRLETVSIACQAPDEEILLVDWLNAIIYEMAIRRMVFAQYSVELKGNRLQGTATGEALDPRRHQPAVEIKGATFTELKVGRNEAGQWLAQCVVDV